MASGAGGPYPRELRVAYVSSLKAVTVKVSFQGSGSIRGVEVTNLGTYWYSVRPDGPLYGPGQGVGKFTERGGVSWRGALYFQTASLMARQKVSTS